MGVRNNLDEAFPSDDAGYEPGAFALSPQEGVLLEKFRRARELSTKGHRVALSVMFFDQGGQCDMTIEDRERIPPS